MKAKMHFEKMEAAKEREQSATDALTALFRDTPSRREDSESIELGFDIKELHARLADVLDARMHYHERALEENEAIWKMLKQKRLVKRFNISTRPVDIMREELLETREIHVTEMRNNMMFVIALALINSLTQELGDTKSFREAIRGLTPLIAKYREEMEIEQSQQKELAKLHSKSRTIAT
jgi:hypothetical protein